MKLRIRMLSLVGSAVLCGCTFIFPDSVLPHETVKIESSIPAEGTRVPAGTVIELRVRYHIQPFVPEQPYYLLACSSDNCKTKPDFAKQLNTAKGIETLKFRLTSASSSVMVVYGSPVFRYNCAANPNIAACSSSNILGSVPVMVRLDH